MQLSRKNIIGDILTFVLVILLPVCSFAQQSKCIISGHVADEQNIPVGYASVAIYADEKPVAGTITDSNGKFTLKIAQNNVDCELAVEFIGYKRYKCNLTPNKSAIELGTIILKENSIVLEGAAISAKESTHKSTVEHTTINAAANLASDKGTAIDILRSASAVTISNDEISIRGNSNILVLMDGIPTTASDLSTIPAGNIKKMEIIIFLL